MWFFSVPFFCLIIFYCVLDSVQMIAEFQRMPFVRVFLSWVEQIGWGAEAVEAQAGPAAPLQSQWHCWLVPLILGWFFWPFNWEFKKTVENLFLPQQMLCLGLYTLPFRAPDSKKCLESDGFCIWSKHPLFGGILSPTYRLWETPRWMLDSLGLVAQLF